MKKKIILIAEGGVNHNGKFEIAKKLINIAAKGGADYIKFQTYHLDEMIVENAPLADYQKKKNLVKSQYEMLKKYDLKRSLYPKLISHCKKKKIKFISSPFDIKSILFLKQLKIKIIKIPSGEITNIPYLKVLGKTSLKIILSTGMSTIEEIKNALSILIKAGAKRSNITIMHCISEYPTRYQDVNLRNIITIKENFGGNVGFSDHTQDNLSSILAVGMGVSVIEKHITFSNKAKGPDHVASLNPKNFFKFVQDVRNAGIILGSKKRKPTSIEKKNSKVVRKSIYAIKRIKKGEKFTIKNISTKRPGKYLSSIHWNKILNKVSKFDFNINQPIKIKK